MQTINLIKIISMNLDLIFQKTKLSCNGSSRIFLLFGRLFFLVNYYFSSSFSPKLDKILSFYNFQRRKSNRIYEFYHFYRRKSIKIHEFYPQNDRKC